jgi:hypothetical protein
MDARPECVPSAVCATLSVMTTGNRDQSGFWFYGRLSPAANAHFRVDEVQVGEATFVNVAWDGIVVWARPDLDDYGWRGAVRSPEEAARVFRLVAGAYALLTERPYTITLEGWIEATNASFRDTVPGFHVRRFTLDALPASDRENVAMRKAIELAGASRERPGFRQALLDLLAAYGDSGDDAFLFAYRAIEDVAREITGSADLATDDWKTFHRHLERDPDEAKQQIEPLTVARRAAAHGDASDTALDLARNERYERLRIARVLVADVMDRDPNIPLSKGDLWLW